MMATTCCCTAPWLVAAAIAQICSGRSRSGGAVAAAGSYSVVVHAVVVVACSCGGADDRICGTDVVPTWWPDGHGVGIDAGAHQAGRAGCGSIGCGSQSYAVYTGVVADIFVFVACDGIDAVVVAAVGHGGVVVGNNRGVVQIYTVVPTIHH